MDTKRVDPIPPEFRNYDEAAEFWDTHDTSDYPDAFRTIEVTSELRGHRYEVEIEAQVVEALQAIAQQQGVTLSHLASDLLRKQLALAE